MPVTAGWYDDEHTILHLRYTDPWTVPEITAQLDELEALLDDTPHDETIDVLLDMQHTTTMPRNILTHIPGFFRSSAFSHPRLGLIVTTSTINRLHEAVNRIFSQVVAQVEMAETEEQALGIIRAAKARRANSQEP